jgi:mannitol-1-phosphate 5-dehydrogenase
LTKSALIFGAGKTGRGFAAQLAFLSGYEIILIDKDSRLIAELSTASQFDVEVLGNPEKNTTITIAAAYHIDDSNWHKHAIITNLIFTSVFGNNLESLGEALAPALQKRSQENHNSLLTIITCENVTDAAALLRRSVQKFLSDENKKWLSIFVGFSESIIFRTCLQPAPHQSPLTVLAQDFFELPCDADELKQALQIHGLKPLKHFHHQLRRKIYTYNCINAVITYLGAKKGYTQLAQAANDNDILITARKAAAESCDAQVAEFQFDPGEQKAWMDAAFAKFADTNIPDPIERNAADPQRKLGRDDRLLGPALLALKHNIHPQGLLDGIMACIDYKDTGNGHAIADLLKEKGVEEVLITIGGLSENEKLFELIKQRILTAHE